MLKSITQNCTINSVLQIWDDDKNHVNRRESIYHLDFFEPKKTSLYIHSIAPMIISVSLFDKINSKAKKYTKLYYIAITLEIKHKIIMTGRCIINFD